MNRILIILLAGLLPIGIQAAGLRKKSQSAPTPGAVEIAEADTIPVLESDTLDTDEPLSLDELDARQDSADSELRFVWRNDTLYVNCSVEALPRHMLVQASDGETMYKMLPMFSNDGETGSHPADSLYRFIWANERVNPYKTPIDSLPDSIHIDLSKYHIPHPGYVTSPFGMRRYRFHYGTDLKVQVGDSLRASWDGQVRIVGWDPRGYGHYVVIRHDNGLETVYGHLSRPLFDENERIYAGEVLGLGGNTGRSTGSHLHYEIRYLGNPINPELIWNFATNTLRDTTSTDYVITKAGTFGHKEIVKQLQTAQYHTIRKGDTLGGIAKRYHTTVKNLCRINGIKENKILQIGKKLRVR